MHYTTEFIRKIKAAAIISQEAEPFYELFQNGKNYTTICDKCHEKMGFNDETGIHNCFNKQCDNRGDIFVFLQKKLGLSFAEVVVYLANKYHVEMPAKKSKTDFGQIEMQQTGDDSYVPNSFQMPNKYVDQLCYLLTPEEFKVLVFIIRRILGFGNKRVLRQDNISLSQINDGQHRDGKRISFGVGISRPMIIKCLKSLYAFRIIKKVGGAGKIGQLIELNLDGDQFDWKALKKRQKEKYALEEMRMKTRKENQRKNQLVNHVNQSSSKPR